MTVNEPRTSLNTADDGGKSAVERTALITGAASGIGLELTRLLAADGHHLVIVGRKQPRLELVAADLRARYGVRVRCDAADLSEPGAAFRLWADITSAGITIDILVNNAGAGLYGALVDQNPQQLERMIQLNVGAPTTLTRLALPHMRERRWGRILNVASVVAYQPGGPFMSTYYATKAYVLSFSKGLARELAGTGVSVTVLSPGPTDTGFDEAAGSTRNVLYNRLPKMNAAAVARAGVEGMRQQSMVVIPGVITKALDIAGELPPRRIALEINRLLWKPHIER
jgi:short-subunit dehydrogenase